MIIWDKVELQEREQQDFRGGKGRTKAQWEWVDSVDKIVGLILSWWAHFRKSLQDRDQYDGSRTSRKGSTMSNVTYSWP